MSEPEKVHSLIPGKVSSPTDKIILILFVKLPNLNIGKQYTWKRTMLFLKKPVSQQFYFNSKLQTYLQKIFRKENLLCFEKWIRLNNEI